MVPSAPSAQDLPARFAGQGKQGIGMGSDELRPQIFSRVLYGRSHFDAGWISVVTEQDFWSRARRTLRVFRRLAGPRYQRRSCERVSVVPRDLACDCVRRISRSGAR